MQINDLELNAFRNRWRDGKYKVVQDALEHITPQSEWMDTCDAVDHPAAKRLANDLRGVQLSGRDLKNLDLGDSFLDFSVFDGSRFDGAQFQWSILNGASFRGCQFHLAQMLPIYGDGTDFRHARLRKSFIEYAKLSNADFSGATLADGRLTSSEISVCNFSGVLTERTDWGWNTMTRCDFVAARFVECELTTTWLDRARLIDATFENCDLRGVDFRGADLSGVRFLGGTFGDVLQGPLTYRTRFDDTPEARRVVAAATTANSHAVEWCPVVEGSGEPSREIPSSRLKGMPGDVVPKSGWWVSPALGGEQGRRYFKAGEMFPGIKSTDWGLVIWSHNPSDQD
ncbi:hypothetical protein C0Z18_32335 [Trinickia dabaoshanensis]|uniref:Pentapeptide repeat-containing protein n=1 Tax=Trinickia dabaoshanensis TaxID=564714 RepID=A0A2N7VAW2_9BURK|nr:pentapeptide repeat-containing protein [Trinickia dabaoshanensis]PMS13652.1 hypothetical protein C0Z18_32335 [Trinickia dabaoshanensis]